LRQNATSNSNALKIRSWNQINIHNTLPVFGAAPHHTHVGGCGDAVPRILLATVATQLPRGTIDLKVGLEEKQHRSWRESNPGHAV
jgi:hypothetical protein